MPKNETSLLIEALSNLLKGRSAHTQEELCKELKVQGFEVNQSKISRLLRKINAVKVVNSQEQVAYSLPREPAPPTINTPLKHLILDVLANEMLVVIFTSPGSASMVARILDYNQCSTEILGAIAGDDTIFVAPKSVKEIEKLTSEIKKLLRD